MYVQLYAKLNVLYIVIIWRKGPCENRQEGEDGENLFYVIYVYIIGGRGRARTGRWGKTVIT